MVAIENITHVAGDTLATLAWTFWQIPPNPLDNPSLPMDTGLWSAKLSVVYRPGDMPVLALDSALGTLLILDGRITPVLDYATSAALPPGVYRYELQVSFSSPGSFETVFSGSWAILPRVV